MHCSGLGGGLLHEALQGCDVKPCSMSCLVDQGTFISMRPGAWVWGRGVCMGVAVGCSFFWVQY